MGPSQIVLVDNRFVGYTFVGPTDPGEVVGPIDLLPFVQTSVRSDIRSFVEV